MSALASTSTTGSSTALVLVALLLVALLLYDRAARRRRAATCARYGHAPDPATIGTRGERCQRCGTRLR